MMARSKTRRPDSPKCPRRSALFALALLLSSATVAFSQSPSESVYDLVIRGGRVYDGAGSPWIRADIAIDDGRFVLIGRVPGRGERELDASGLAVSPGWIDMMDQSGAVLLRNGLAENKLRMGVTTAIGGEGGTPRVSPAPSSADSPEARPPESAGQSARRFFDTLESQGISINFGSYFSETQARVEVLGREARAPSAEELERMQQIMADAMQAGALGMTTALIYPPSSYASTDELVEMARVAAAHGGIYASHIRGEGKELVEAVSEAIEIGERAGLPVEIFHFKAAYEPGWGTLIRAAIETIEAARDRGVDVAADLYPYTAGGTGLEATVPSWAHDGGVGALKERLRDLEVRARLKREVETGSPGWWGTSSRRQVAGIASSWSTRATSRTRDSRP